MPNISEAPGGEIHHLYLWVHPQWDAPITMRAIEKEMSEHESLIRRLGELPSTALMQIADSPRKEFEDDAIYTRYLNGLAETDEFAKEVLGVRYVIWDVPGSRFFRAQEPKNASKVISDLGLVACDQSVFLPENTPNSLTREPKPLAAINVYGKELDICPLEQATNGGLHNLAAVVRYHSVETPGRIIPTSVSEVVHYSHHGTTIYPSKIDQSMNRQVASFSRQ